MILRTRWLVVVVAALLTASCGDEGTGRPELPATFDAASAGEGKADTLTKWFTTMKGAATIGADIKGQTATSEWFHGYTVKLAAGDAISVAAEGADWGMTVVYGPQLKNGQWGQARALAWIDPVGKVYRGTIKSFIAAQAGAYLVIVGSPWSGGYSYTLTVGCLAGTCMQKYCVEYETVDENGVSLRNFYAINASSYAEAQKQLSYVPDAINKAIRSGSCTAGSQVCPKIVAQPVCGEPSGGKRETYNSVCQFKVQIRQMAGESDQAKGHWDSGACQTYCVVWEAADENGVSQRAFYAENVATYQEGKDRLAQVPYFVNENIYTGTCGQQQMACVTLYKPVCADTPTTVTKTYSNLCFFKAEVMKLAGDVGTHKGKWTEGACVCDASTEWWRQYKFTSTATCAVVKFQCQPLTLYFANDCGCGCEQGSSCPEWIDCMPPVTQSCLDLQKKCPYSKVAQ